MRRYPDDEFTHPKPRLGRNLFDFRQSSEPLEKPYVKIEIDVCFLMLSLIFVFVLNYWCS